MNRSYEEYHLDHIYSISDGFKNEIPADVIANPNNLQMLWCLENMTKHGDSDVSIGELYVGYSKFLNYN